MKLAVVYASVHHQNTQKLLRGLEVDMKLYSVDEAKKVDMGQYDLVGIASGIYFGKIHKSLLEYLESKPALPKKVFAIVTCGDGSDKHKNPVNELLNRLGYESCGTYVCKGFDTYGPLKLIGGLNKGHPNKKDMLDCSLYVQSLISANVLPETLEQYVHDASKPYGSRENPVVVGIPERSTTLIFDEKNNRWILTDGLGNGWIR